MGSTVWSYLENTYRRVPEKGIFCDEQTVLTASRIYRIASGVASFLAERIPTKQPVVVLTGRNVYTPCCYLGIAGAGDFYAPIDPTVPKARLDAVLSVISADYMITDRENEALARSLSFCGDVYILEDIIGSEPNPELLERRLRGLTENSALYVIFTSGSSGVPKGVITSHRSLMNYIDAVTEVLGVAEDDVLGNQSPLDYIAAIRDIYIPLKTGASVYIIPKKLSAMPTAMFDALNEHRVTVLCWSAAGLEIPAKLNAFAESRPLYVNKVLFSGSVISNKCLRAWQESLPDAVFINQYGPTEATASCTYYVIPDVVKDGDAIPIGKPFDNYNVFLLSEDNRTVSDGEIGEICVSGAGIALGYYGDRKRTEESFIQNPLNGAYREIIYKTGDLGRFRSDGNLEFHGRTDRQVKHMGHRIELNEIELAADGIEGVGESCAMYDAERELLYLFYTGDASSREITQHFRDNMPSFMVPRRIKRLETIPHLPNGKTDMKCLSETYM